MSLRALRHFASDYRGARLAFLEAARTAGARITSHPLSARAMAGHELAIDVARLGPEQAEALVVVSSGVHGVEGFAGSALQHLLLEETETRGGLPRGVALLLVHAVNPWGFDALRRVNEHNVDLNRNFLRHPQDHEERPDYEQLDPHINPQILDEEHDRLARAALAAFAARHGFVRLQEVLSQGQSHRPEGLQYTGSEPEEGNLLLRRIASVATRGASRVVWIDVHTGLGPRGQLELITEEAPDHPVYARGRAWYGGAFRSTRAGDSSSAPLRGVIETGVTESVAPDCVLTPFTAEFGTVPADRVFWALRADNWLAHHGDRDSEQGRRIRSTLLEVFRPDDASWGRAVLEQGMQVVRRAAEALSADRQRPLGGGNSREPG